jgi:hypothetical protein
MAAVTKLLHHRQLPDGTFAQAKQTLEGQKVVNLAAVTSSYMMVWAAIAAWLVCLNKGLALPLVQVK